MADPTAPAPVQPQAFDMAGFLKVLQGMLNPDPLGATARANARPGGRTPASDWAAMFAPTSPERQAAMTDHPSLTQAQVAQSFAAGQPSGLAASAMAQPTGVAPSYQAPAPRALIPGTVAAAKVAHQPLFPGAAQTAAQANPLSMFFNLFR